MGLGNTVVDHVQDNGDCDPSFHILQHKINSRLRKSNEVCQNLLPLKAYVEMNVFKHLQNYAAELPSKSNSLMMMSVGKTRNECCYTGAERRLMIENIRQIVTRVIETKNNRKSDVNYKGDRCNEAATQ
ncbi:hypothetical protein NPIL_158261 [Nephila pilipes]|uniref:Uncharacterized protein n=1 Tax=Nephila pilipes TaxID=299642 RepID=A0A8X6P5J1_NEPPI|nr:hypothetical protein NPIL_158261 [Nephila pilipes]